MSTNNKHPQPPVKPARDAVSESKPIMESKSPFLAVEYAERKVAIKRSTSYTDTIASIKRAFTQLQHVPNQDIELFVKLEQVVDPVQIVEELWPELVSSLFLVQVVTASQPPSADSDLPDNHIRIQAATCTGIVQTFNVSRTCMVSRVKTVIRERMFPEMEEWDQHKLRLFFKGERMHEARTLEFHGMENGDEILVLQEQRGGKPVIYLFSPTAVSNVQVQLALVKAWRFSAIYPPTPINVPSNDSLGEVISWDVDTRPDGTLLDQSTNREVAYLFWEAHTNPKPPISPPTTPFSELVAFDPARPTVLPSNSALLSFDKVTGYIDDALLAMELHAEARTSFITYWLPNLSKHSHIALRFLPQDQYEASAPLQVTPVPEITTRVFMLFMGIQESELGTWETSQVPAEEWSRIVGVDRPKAKDASLFRVLEWGGLEIE